MKYPGSAGPWLNPGAPGGKRGAKASQPDVSAHVRLLSSRCGLEGRGKKEGEKIMAKFVCPCCHFSFWAAPDERCTHCGYHFEYLKKWKDVPRKQLEAQKELVKIRSFIFSIIEKDDMQKGLHAEITLTNHGMMISVFEKYQNGALVNKRWKLTPPQVFLVPYDDIVSIEKQTYRGKPASFYTYQSRTWGNLRLLCADGTISSKISGSEEMKRMVTEWM